jgi:hypothetical protein
MVSQFKVSSISPFQPREAGLKWRKRVPPGAREGPFCASVEFQSSPREHHGNPAIATILLYADIKMFGIDPDPRIASKIAP